MSGILTTICVGAPAGRRPEALAGALSALAYANAPCLLRRFLLQVGDGARPCTVTEAISAIPEIYGGGAQIEVTLDVTLNTRRVVSPALTIRDDVFTRIYDYEPFIVDVHDPLSLRDILSLEEVIDLLARLCASPHVITCANSIARTWPAAVEANATYHADGNAARDLALSWIHLREACRLAELCCLPLGSLRARVEAAPPGASVGVAASLGAWAAHEEVSWRAAGKPRPRLPGDAELTREQVLAALSTPPAVLIEALEAAAVPDEEWRAAEALATAAQQGTSADGRNAAVDVTAGRNTDWIALHAPFAVRGLPNGGVILATHPSRVLWPLWSGALSLLDIRP